MCWLVEAAKAGPLIAMALFAVCSAAYAQPAIFELTHKGYLSTPKCAGLSAHRCTLVFAEHGATNIFNNHETRAHPMYGWYSRESTASNPHGYRRWLSVPRFYVALEFLDGESWNPAPWIGYGISRTDDLNEHLKGTNWAVLFMYNVSNPEATIKLFDRGRYFWMFAALGTDQAARIAVWDTRTWCIYLFEKERGPAVALTSTSDILGERDEGGPSWEHGCGPWPQHD